jgi:hypothetical protein
MKRMETVPRALNFVKKVADLRLTKGKRKKTHLQRTEKRMKRIETIPRALNMVKKVADFKLTRGKRKKTHL